MQTKKTRLFYAKINTATFFLKEVIALVCNFVLPRLILGYFGSSYNGLVASITQFLNIVSFFRIGIAGAARLSFYSPLAKNDSTELSSSVNTFQRYMKKSGIVVLLYIIALSIGYPLIFGTEFAFLDCFILALALGASTFAQYFFGIIYSAVLEADQKAYILNILACIANVIVTILSCILIIIGLSLPLVKVACAIVWIIHPLFIYFFVSRKYHINKKAKADPGILKRKNDVMLHSIANIVHENVDVTTLTILSTKALISVYSVYAIVINGLKQVISIFTNSLEAPFGEMFAKSEFDNIQKSMQLYEYVAFGLSSVLYGPALVLIIPFVRLYTSGVNDVEYILPLYAFFVILSGLFFSLRTPYLTVVQAGGYYKETRLYAIIEAALNLIISFALFPVFGLIGVALGTIIANLFRTFSFALFIYKRILHIPIIDLFKRFFWLFLNFITIYCLTNKLTSLIASQGWYYWIICGFACVGISLFVVFFTSIVFYHGEFYKTFKLFFRREKSK